MIEKESCLKRLKIDIMKAEEREKIFNKYNGKCAYCGCKLEKGWHVDELQPVRRNYKWNKDKTRYIYDGTCMNPQNLNINNQMPACPSCNINKHSMSLEDFREFIKHFIISLNRDSTQYKVAKRYGLVSENEISIVFYFEKQLTKQIVKNCANWNDIERCERAREEGCINCRFNTEF